MRKMLSLLLLVIFAGNIEAATITKRYKKNGGLKIDEGKNTGFTKGAEVCIYDKDDTQIHCTKVFKAKKTMAFIKIRKKKHFKKIQKGMTVKLKNAVSSQTQTVADKETEITEETMEATPATRGTNIKIGYVLSPITPSVYNVIYYGDPNQTEVNTLWKADRTSSLAPVGFGLELGIALGSMDLNLGLRSRVYKPFTIISNYTSDRAQFAETKLTADSQGVWIDFTWLKAQFGTFSIDFGNGLDVDISKLVVDTTQQDDNDESFKVDLFKATSTFTTISLRNNINFNFFFNPIGFQLGGSVLVPLSGTAVDSITVTDPQAEQYLGGDKTPEEDLRAAINHRVSSVALELFISVYYSF